MVARGYITMLNLYYQIPVPVLHYSSLRIYTFFGQIVRCFNKYWGILVTRFANTRKQYDTKYFKHLLKPIGQKISFSILWTPESRTTSSTAWQIIIYAVSLKLCPRNKLHVSKERSSYIVLQNYVQCVPHETLSYVVSKTMFTVHKLHVP